jgi:hypothetical protein
MTPLVPVLNTRRYGTGSSGTFSAATLSKPDGTEPWKAYILEDDWRGNHRRVSCIPAGRYRALLVQRPRHGQVYELQDVPDRSAILIHAGNTEEDTEGCLIVGTRVGALTVDADEDTGERNAIKGAVLASRDALEGLHRATGNAPEILVIIEWEPNVGERENAA